MGDPPAPGDHLAHAALIQRVATLASRPQLFQPDDSHVLPSTRNRGLRVLLAEFHAKLFVRPGGWQRLSNAEVVSYIVCALATWVLSYMNPFADVLP